MVLKRFNKNQIPEHNNRRRANRAKEVLSGVAVSLLLMELDISSNEAIHPATRAQGVNLWSKANKSPEATEKMELAYLSDPMARFNALNVYPTWEESTYSYKHTKTQKCYKETKTSEKNCSICQQKKKRILSDYIRNKQMDCRNTTSIQEEDEEAEEVGSNSLGQGKQNGGKE